MRLGGRGSSSSGRRFNALESRCMVASFLFQAALAFVPASQRPPVLVPRQKHQPPVLKINRLYCEQTHPAAGRDMSAASGWGAGEGAGEGCRYRVGRSRVMSLGVTLQLASASSDSMLEGTAKREDGQPTSTSTAAPTHHNEDFLFEQKLESVKAALLCGTTCAVARLLAVGAGAAVPTFIGDALAAPEAAPSSVLFGLASGFAQGALFGLTYRYVVRSDRSTTSSRKTPQMDGFTVSHLGDGCVAAFALTSALGQSEIPLTLAAGEFVDSLGRGEGLLSALVAVVLPALPFVPRAAGGLLLYSAARAAIDRALDEGVIKPFP